MRWGRRKASDTPYTKNTAASAVLIVGTVLCAVFFLVAAGAAHPFPAYPAEMAGEAIQTFMREHTSLTYVLGIDEYFPPDAVEVGAFEEKSEAGYREFVERQWSFGDYMRDALRVLLGGTSP